MKFVIGIVMVLLLIAALILYLILMLNAHDMTFCGDVTNRTDNGYMVTRVYSTDLNADETLSEIVLAMNEGETGTVTSEQLTEILATYQNIIYAPVFTVDITKADNSTYVLSGSVFNGMDENGEPVTPDYLYKNLSLTTAVSNGTILCAQNVYPLSESGEEGFVERNRVVDPIVTDVNHGAAFAFRDCDSYRMVFTGTDENNPPVITLIYTYDVVADNPLDFTGIEGGVLAYTLSVEYDENGQLAPTLNIERNYIINEE